MPKGRPVSIRRKSFGGQSGIGIWWRKRSAPASILPEEDEETSNVLRNRDLSSDTSSSSRDPAKEKTLSITEESPTKKTKGASATKKAPPPSFFEEPVLGWDDDLCRPIYHRNVNHRDAIATIDSFDDELVRAVSSSDSGVAECTETDISTESIDEELSESSQNPGDSFAASPSAIAKKKFSSSKTFERNMDVQDERGDDATSFLIPALKRTRTFGERGRRRRPLSLILMQEEEEHSLTLDKGPRRISLESSLDAAPIEEQEVDSVEKTEAIPRQLKAGRRSKKPRSHDPSNSLEKAREYFASLDQKQPLTLDATLSPPVSSRVTRTNRKTNLASPGINREYKAYSDSIAGDGSSGISPLSIKDYASSRKLHFQSKGELVDGFLDD